jgi:Skp family chaperone for outer membrane proteins
MAIRKLFTLTNFTLLTALTLSTIAAWYSILGLTAIFAAAVIPIIIMGSALEISKVVTTVWLHKYWAKVKWAMRVYLVLAVIALAFLTSLGVFGFLSKAHSDQSLVSGDVQSKIAVYDTKIQTARENIETDRKALKQLDESVDQVMGRSTDEKGADKAVALRRNQQKERGRLLAEIEAEQKKISSLNEERAPIAAEVRKVEAEVGPIKYIAALIYGDNPDANLLERAVRWVIILIVSVFDPLALTLVLAANGSRMWDREEPQVEEKPKEEPQYEPDDGPLTEEQIEQIDETVEQPKIDEYAYLKKPWAWFTSGSTVGLVSKPEEKPEEKPEDILCFKCGTTLLNAPGIGLFCPNLKCDVRDGPFEEEPVEIEKQKEIEEPVTNSPYEIITDNVTSSPPYTDIGGGYVSYEGKSVQIDALKQLNPKLFMIGADGEGPNKKRFGTEFPKIAKKGEVFVRVDVLPNRVYKFDGSRWIEISKTQSNTYLYDEQYIQYLISKVDTGEYDIDLLSENEKSQIEIYLQKQQG